MKITQETGTSNGSFIKCGANLEQIWSKFGANLEQIWSKNKWELHRKNSISTGFRRKLRHPLRISFLPKDKTGGSARIKQKRLTCVKRFIFVTPTESLNYGTC